MSSVASIVALTAVGSPAALLALVGGSCLAGKRLPERAVGVLVKLAFVTSLASCITLAVMLASSGSRSLVIPFGEWFATPEYRFGLSLLVDGLSLTFATLTAALCGLVGAFAHRYLHREPGYHRFFVLLALFALGMMLTVLAGTIEMVYGAWELVGLSSALLIAFYHDRREPLENGFHAFAVYRVSDLGLLTAVVLVHHFLGTGSFERLFGEVPELHSLSSGQATVIALLLLLAALGKSALLPVSGWLPRAMEGPTPSSAIFYGALSVHAGVYLLLRTSPFLAKAPLVSFLVVLIGLLTALHAALLQQVRTDIKGALAYASLTQVGIIVAEVGLGLRLVPLVHVVGHACSRSLQFLRAPSLLHDFHETERTVPRRDPFERGAPARKLEALADAGVALPLRPGRRSPGRVSLLPRREALHGIVPLPRRRRAALDAVARGPFRFAPVEKGERTRCRSLTCTFRGFGLSSRYPRRARFSRDRGSPNGGPDGSFCFRPARSCCSRSGRRSSFIFGRAAPR